MKENTESISLCMITKNEEDNLEYCLNSAKDIADEIIVVDTGSTDKTKAIAKKFDARVFDFKWVDDFSAARNESLRHATKDWILVLDADERLDKGSLKMVTELTSDKNNDAFLFLQKNCTNDASIAGFVNEGHKNDGKSYAGWYGSFIARLFRNKKGFEFEGTVHELVEPSIERKNGRISAANVVLSHYGNAEPEAVKKKRRFYLGLCMEKVRRNPDASSYYELGVLQKENGDLEDAVKSLKKAVELSHGHGLALYELGVISERQKNYDDAINYYTESLRARNSSEAYHSLGVCYMKKGMHKEAYRNLVKAMMLNPNKHAIYNSLGAVLEKSGNLEDAAKMLEISIRLSPKNAVGHYNLAVVFDRKKDYENAIKNYEKAAELGHNKGEEIKKRVKHLRILIMNNPKYGYGFKVGG
ncbi:glycosyltransferase [Candidatus Woesearchaeota archaeon]|nr:glycosyltransferase [Candidatus Woesearchaeota archaeon]